MFWGVPNYPKLIFWEVLGASFWVSGRVLDGLGVSRMRLGVLCMLFGALGGVLEGSWPSWRHLEASWRLLGRSWRRLGGVLGRRGCVLEAMMLLTIRPTAP